MTSYFKRFFQLEAASGLFLLVVLVIALGLANSNLHELYQQLIQLPVQVRIGALNLEKPLLLWVNDGLMAIFFLLLALEINREVMVGDLSSRAAITLPLIAAIGGILFPALVYYGLNHGDPSAIAGWPIATTTDIAFTLAVISLLGPRVPPALKIFLVALSIVDDIIAIAIIAIFYTGTLSWLAIGLALFGIALLVLMNIFGVKRIGAYLLVGLFVWVCVLKSNIHATLAGVIIGLLIPFKTDDPNCSPAYSLEHMLHPWVAFLVLPVFVFCNGGISFSGMSIGTLFSAVPLGISLGLFAGKTIGVFILSMLAIKVGIGEASKSIRWPHLLGGSALTGIGFTMSLFLTTLAFGGNEYENLARQGVLLGSVVSCVFGVSVLCLYYRFGKSNQSE